MSDKANGYSKLLDKQTFCFLTCVLDLDKDFALAMSMFNILVDGSEL